MKTLIHLCLLVFISLVFSIKAYSQWQLSGKVEESNGKPLPFANVLLLNGKDSSLVKGAVSDGLGAYTINNIHPGNYILSATMVGYKQAYGSPLIITDQQAQVKVPPLTLSYDTKQLKEVAVTSTRPFIEQQIDRTVVNVAGSIIASGSTALEVLEKCPGVSVDHQNNGLQLRGKDGVILQIDGKQTYLAMADVVALLRSTSSENIDQIELLTNPSSKYDAAGNSGIINIRMKKNNTIGTNGALSLAGGFGRYHRERGSLQLNHRTEKLNLFGNYSANRGGNYWDWDFSIYRNPAEGGERSVINQEAYFRFLDWGQNLKAGLDYLAGKNTVIGLVWTGLWSNNQERGPAAASFRWGESGPVYLQTLTDKAQSTALSNQVANLNLQHTFGKKGGQLSADIDIGHFTRGFSNTLLTETLLSENPSQPLSGLLNQMPTTIHIRTFKADYNRSFSDSWKMEAGLKGSSVGSDNNMSLSSGPAEHLQPDLALSNHFQYSERVEAAYLNFFGKVFAKTDLQVGLRAEHTHSVGNSITLDNKVIRDYLNLFPSLFISRPLTSNHSLSFSYSRRIDRPNYQQLNPARSYIDPYAFGRGNAYLRPQYTQLLELKHEFKDIIFTSLGASYINDFVFFLIQPVDNQKAEGTPENIGRSQVYNLTLSFPITMMKGWNLQTSLLGIYSQFKYTYHGIPLQARQVSGRLNVSNSFTLGKGWTGELTGWVSTPSVNAMWHSPWLGSLDAGLQKSLTSNLKAKLSIQDMLHTNKRIGIIQAPDFGSTFRYAMDTRIAMLNLTYNFGKGQLKGMRQRKTGSEEEMQRTN
jgi:hypothetical protein